MAGAGAVENQTGAVRGTCKSCNTDDERLTFMECIDCNIPLCFLCVSTNWCRVSLCGKTLCNQCARQCSVCGSKYCNSCSNTTGSCLQCRGAFIEVKVAVVGATATNNIPKLESASRDNDNDVFVGKFDVYPAPHMAGSFSREPVPPAVAYRFSPLDVNGNPVFTQRPTPGTMTIINSPVVSIRAFGTIPVPIPVDIDTKEYEKELAEWKQQQQQKTETKTEAKAVATPLFSAREIGQNAAHAYHHNCFRFILDDDYIEMEKTIPLIADTIKEVTRLCGIYSTLDSLREYFNGRVSECKANDTRRRDQNLVMDYIRQRQSDNRVKPLKESDIADILKSLVCMTIEKLIKSKSSDLVLFFCSKNILSSSS